MLSMAIANAPLVAVAVSTSGQVCGNRADGLPARYQHVNLLIPALVPLQQGAAGRWSRRRVGQWCQAQRVVFPAPRVLSNQALDRSPEIRQEMVAVGNLDGPWCALSRAVGVAAATIAADDLWRRVSSQPRRELLG